MAAGTVILRNVDWTFDMNGDDQNYTSFHPTLNAFIEANYKKGDDSISFAMDHGLLLFGQAPTHKIDFKAMTQTRLVTPYTVRRIKRAEFPNNIGIHPCSMAIYWEWYAGGIVPAAAPSQYLVYDMVTCAMIEHEFINNPFKEDIQITSQGLNITINLKRMEQTNTQTGRSRPIRRVVNNSFTPMGAHGLAEFVQAQTALAASTQNPMQNLAYFQQMTNWVVVPPTELTNEETCPICTDLLKGKANQTSPAEKVVRLSRCHGHYYHESCACIMLQNKPKCSLCGFYYNVPIGNCPDGIMTYNADVNITIPGYNGYGTIIIGYEIPDGIQGPSHQNPGAEYHGTERQAFLPNTLEGQEVLRLLSRAFERRLTLTVGTSLTNGTDNCVVWTTIHHKTSLNGGPFGYPDEGYLKRVKQELNDIGITN